MPVDAARALAIMELLASQRVKRNMAEPCQCPTPSAMHNPNIRLRRLGPFHASVTV